MRNQFSHKFTILAVKALLVWAVLLPVPVFSQNIVLQLRNGDRVSGMLVSSNTNQVVISTPWAKDLKISAVDIVKRDLLTNGIPTIAAGTVSTNQAGTKSVTATAPPPKAKPLIQTVAWHGKIDLGTDLGFSEKNRQSYYGKAKVVYVPQSATNAVRTIGSRFKDTIEFQGTYGRADGVLSANQAGGSSKTDFDLTRKLFIYNLVGVAYDQIRQIDFQYEVGPGVGYRLVQRTNFFLNTEVGFDFQEENYTGGRTKEHFFVRLAEDTGWKITKDLTFDEKLEVFPSVESSGVFRVRFEGNLRYSLWQNIGITFSVVNLYDSDPAKSVAKNDLQIRSLLGVSF